MIWQMLVPLWPVLSHSNPCPDLLQSPSLKQQNSAHNHSGPHYWRHLSFRLLQQQQFCTERLLQQWWGHCCAGTPQGSPSNPWLWAAKGKEWEQSNLALGKPLKIGNPTWYVNLAGILSKAVNDLITFSSVSFGCLSCLKVDGKVVT